MSKVRTFASKTLERCVLEQEKKGWTLIEPVLYNNGDIHIIFRARFEKDGKAAEFQVTGDDVVQTI